MVIIEAVAKSGGKAGTARLFVKGVTPEPVVFEDGYATVEDDVARQLVERFPSGIQIADHDPVLIEEHEDDREIEYGDAD